MTAWPPGYGAGGRIRIRPGLEGGMHLRVLLHEWTHEILHNRKATDAAEIPRAEAIRELEADATACAVAAVMGYDFGREAWAYLSPRGVTPEQVKDALPRIHRAVQVVTRAVGHRLTFALTRAEAAEALARLYRAGMVQVVPAAHRGLSAEGRPVWAMGYAITDLGRRTLAGRVPIPLPRALNRTGIDR